MIGDDLPFLFFGCECLEARAAAGSLNCAVARLPAPRALMKRVYALAQVREYCCTVDLGPLQCHQPRFAACGSATSAPSMTPGARLSSAVNAERVS